MNAIDYREEVSAQDAQAVRRLAEESGMFNSDEADIAAELVDERLAKGLASGYRFLFAEEAGTVQGYTAYGHTPCTRSSFDLYWIIVDSRLKGRGLGTKLMAETEKRVRDLGGTRIYVETSSREEYEPTRGFYVHCGYRLEAVLQDFYAPGDSLHIYVKELT
ncbi:MAG: GNAT family N-acetyltransferase [Spirochaetales bacterium]|nr:GNAT family N-acetyltransferase [Spirochaetales bacterium]